MWPGTFIDPDTTLADLDAPHEALGVPIYSGYQAIRHARALRGQNRIFDAIVRKVKALDIPYEDQCSARYYYDLTTTLRDMAGEYDRVVEVGVYMGGSSSVFAGCIERFDFDLDLVDISPDFLRFTHERIRRLFPESVGRVRLFHGTLPQYVREVMTRKRMRAVIHHDGAHAFDQVVKDMASLSFVQDKIHAIIAQDTHLRGTPQEMNFVDLAIAAVFGNDLNYVPIGTVYSADDGLTHPNSYQGNYFKPDAPEGLVLPMAMNRFEYPHPSMKLEAFV
ncbi:class I SAM-dependent methyltransferase [Sphingomonas japonica]|uniref:Methyltransferase domain-containing protein n=1 Tax=Sphingomonas japonica TaxID=511662 RepID=A0ABX0TX63_9SPHN|nr:class I SAM-dependent methyltransferase [Sphingomonas japonica]NIJ22828.1 hypothetical protein [Sphingomonas japonica]